MYEKIKDSIFTGKGGIRMGAQLSQINQSKY